ncbi:MAG: hypothetical protein LUG56_07525 [Lachnospiraceae bacterium]|nr:hypothetical protein [Lachnospiraceae bacterium]
MNALRMNKDDLSELYLLLHVYIRTNGTEQRDLDLLSEVAGRYYTACRQPALQESPDVCVPGSMESPDDLPARPESAADADINDINAKYSFSLQEDDEAADTASTDTQDIKEHIRELHRNGATIRAIAAQVHKSTTYVHRAIHEQV